VWGSSRRRSECTDHGEYKQDRQCTHYVTLRRVRECLLPFFFLCVRTRVHVTLPFVLSVQHTQHKDPCPSVGFEPANPANDRPQILTLDRSAIGMLCINAGYYLWYGVSLSVAVTVTSVKQSCMFKVSHQLTVKPLSIFKYKIVFDWRTLVLYGCYGKTCLW
jgi:hypothetical protein